MKHIQKTLFVILMVLVVLFFIGYQTHELIVLSDGYLGEQVDGSILPIYALFLVLVPVLLFVGVFVPSKAILALRIPISHVSVSHVRLVYCNKVKTDTVDIIINHQQTLQVIRC